MRFHDGRGFPSQNRRKRKSPVVLSDHTWCYHLSCLLLDKTTYLDLYAWGFILNIAFDTGRRYLVVSYCRTSEMMEVSCVLCFFNSVWKRMHVLLFVFLCFGLVVSIAAQMIKLCGCFPSSLKTCVMQNMVHLSIEYLTQLFWTGGSRPKSRTAMKNNANYITVHG